MILLSRKLFFITIVISILANQVQSIDPITAALIVKDIGTTIYGLWQFVQKTQGKHVDLEDQILNKVIEMSDKIKQADAKITSTATWTVESLKNYMKLNNQLDRKLIEIRKIRSSILSSFKDLRRLAKHRTTLEDVTLLEYAHGTVSSNTDSVNYLLDQLSALYIGSDEIRGSREESVLTMLAQNIQNDPLRVCGLGQSAQHFLYTFYSEISITEIQGYAAVQFAWMILKTFDQGNFTTEATIMRDAFQERADQAVKMIREIMKKSDRAVWRCDPSKHIKGSTYDEVTGIMQGYILNEAEMSDNVCTATCSDFRQASFHKCFQPPCHEPGCTGKILNCQDKGRSGSYCPSKGSSQERYEYVDYGGGKTLGTKGSCSQSVQHFSGWTRGFVHCSYCFCLCDDVYSPKSDRYFNLRDTLSNIAENKVVTGVRFIKEKRVFHVQIQEGQLQAKGHINDASLKWKPVDNYDIKKSANGVDYYTMTSDERIVDLDEINSDIATQIVTGVRFKVVNGHIKLEIQLTSFDYDSGILGSKHYWKTNDQQSRNPIRLKDPDVPIRTVSASLPTSKNNQLITFTHTDIDKDAAQHTVPFFDVQEVVSTPPTPLSGIGIYHKATEGYGGFVAPKLFSYDYEPYVETPNLKSSEENIKSSLYT